MRFNPALEFAVEEANHLRLPVVACFGLLDGANGFPEANARHYAFLLQGLSDAAGGLARRGIGFVMRKASPAEVALDLGRRAALIVLDRGYLAIQKRWYGAIVRGADTRVVQVEGDVVVPVEVASNKHEHAARTLRPKLHRVWDQYLEPLAERQPVLITVDADNPNKADALLLIDGADPGSLDEFERCIILFDGRDEGQLSAARGRWKSLKAEGRTVSYWKENPGRGWEKQA